MFNQSKKIDFSDLGESGREVGEKLKLAIDELELKLKEAKTALASASDESKLVMAASAGAVAGSLLTAFIMSLFCRRK